MQKILTFKCTYVNTLFSPFFIFAYTLHTTCIHLFSLTFSRCIVKNKTVIIHPTIKTHTTNFILTLTHCSTHSTTFSNFSLQKKTVNFFTFKHVVKHRYLFTFYCRHWKNLYLFRVHFYMHSPSPLHASCVHVNALYLSIMFSFLSSFQNPNHPMLKNPLHINLKFTHVKNFSPYSSTFPSL